MTNNTGYLKSKRKKTLVRIKSLVNKLIMLDAQLELSSNKHLALQATRRLKSRIEKEVRK